MNGLSRVLPSSFALAASLLLVSLVVSPATAQYLYVTDNGDNTIKKITADGVVSTLVSTGLDGPFGITVDLAGNLYVANLNGDTISKYNSAGVQQTFNLSGESLQFMTGLTSDRSGNLYVVNAALPTFDSIISKITPDGVVSTFATGLGVANAFEPVIDQAGNVYTEVYGDNTLSKFDSAGVRQTFSLSGGALTTPSGLSIDSFGSIFVSNQATNSISKVTSDGFVSTFVATNALTGVGDLESDDSGNVYALTYDFGTILKYNSAGVQQTFSLSGDALLSPGMMVFVSATAPEPGAFVFLATGLFPLVGVIVRRRNKV